MFTKFATYTALAAASISGVFASPINYYRRQTIIPHFNGWQGISSLNNFDDFYGYNNFAGICKSQVVLKQKEELVCHTEKVVIIQQRLAVLQEIAKRIITEQICEVETQTVVFQQFHASLGSFHDDLFRKSGRQVGYDANVADLYSGLFNHDGSLSDYDFGFSGSDIGKHVIVASGNNWNPSSSPSSVQSAYDATQSAYQYSGGDLSDINDIPSETESASVSEYTDSYYVPPSYNPYASVAYNAGYSYATDDSYYATDSSDATYTAAYSYATDDSSYATDDSYSYATDDSSYATDDSYASYTAAYSYATDASYTAAYSYATDDSSYATDSSYASATYTAAYSYATADSSDVATTDSSADAASTDVATGQY